MGKHKAAVVTLAQAREHAQRVKRKRQRIGGLQALMATHEELGNADEAKRLNVKIRLLRQELNYME